MLQAYTNGLKNQMTLRTGVMVDENSALQYSNKLYFKYIKIENCNFS